MLHEPRIYGDTTSCHKCGKQWDTNDPAPPKCVSDESQNKIEKLREIIRKPTHEQ